MHRLLVAGLAALMTLLALAGCTSPAEPPNSVEAEADLVVVIPPGAFDEAGGGPWYAWDGPTEAPATIRFVNEDLAWHRILVLPAAAQAAPSWAADDHGDGSGGGHHHDHGATDAGADAHGTTPLADFGINASQEVIIRIEEPGLFTLHCHPHPWMEAILDVGGSDQTFGVERQNVVASRFADGVTAENDGTETPFPVDAPNLVQVKATVRWDDAEDDKPAGDEVLNQADTLRANLVAPDGATVATQEATERAGQVDVVFEAPTDWPAAIPAPSLPHAAASLAVAVPDNTTYSGTWRLVVEVLDAPGAVPGDDQGLPDGVDDDGQAWTATITVVNAWPQLTT